MHDAVLFCICSSTKLIIGSVRKARCVFPGNRRGKIQGGALRKQVPENPGKDSQESGAGRSREEPSGNRCRKIQGRALRKQVPEVFEKRSEGGRLWLRQQNFTVILSPLIETFTHHPPLQGNAFFTCRRPVLFGPQSPIPAREAACPLTFFSWLSPEAVACPYPGMIMFCARAIVFSWTV